MAQADGDACEDVDGGEIRAAWKEYIRQTFPHAFTQVRNFMLASIAEGRNFEDEEENMKRGDAVRCDLTLGDIDKALVFKGIGSETSSARDSNPMDSEEQGIANRVWKSARLVVHLANLTCVGQTNLIDKEKNITKHCWPPVTCSSSAQG